MKIPPKDREKLVNILPNIDQTCRISYPDRKKSQIFFADLTIPVFTGFRGLFTVFRNSHFFVDLNQLLPISEINGNLCAGFLTFPDKFWDSWGIGHNYVNRKSIFYEYRKI